MISHDCRVSFLQRRCLALCVIGLGWLMLAASSPAQTGSVDSTFKMGGGPDNPVNVVSEQSDGKILVGGGFALFSSFVRHGLARLTATGSVDTAFVPVLPDLADVKALRPLPNG